MFGEGLRFQLDQVGLNVDRRKVASRPPRAGAAGHVRNRFGDSPAGRRRRQA